MTYLDYQATTPIAPEVEQAMAPWIADRFANPHSPSRWGNEAEAAIEVARKRIEKAVDLRGGRIAFTGSATEALNWALKGTVENARATRQDGRNRVITVATEHAAVLDTCEWLAEQGIDLTILPVDREGRLDLDLLARELDDRVLMVAVMMVNNEIGVTQAISAISRMAHGVGAIMVCDAVQAFGRVEICEGPDLVALSAHKIHGPKAIGALWMRKGKEPAPLIHGGGQELGLRSGTLSPALCVGFGAAAKLAAERMTKDYDLVQRLSAAAKHALGPDWIINGSTAHRYPGNLSIRRDGIDAARLLADLRDMAFSLGSACASGSGRPSHVLRAIGLDYREARSSIRLGFGRYTTQQDLVAACKQLATAAKAQEHLVA
ncbi:cysteine desulfurase NifS [Sphingomonas limnosediminicola]|jgi:cysteine desulfurase|uniref:Cysteine desulfurase n=1 Tax=Sphingomonas limnosediminicola TaxID=940133 RepID=A0ABP7KUJ0_9SPHN